GQNRCVRLARALPGETVAQLAIGIREHAVRRLADERVAKCELGLACEARLAPEGDELAVRELIELFAEMAAPVPEKRSDAAPPEGRAESARRPEQPPHLRLQLLEASLRHRQHRFGQPVRSALGGSADQLLEVEGISRCVARERCYLLGGYRIAQDPAHERLA